MTDFPQEADQTTVADDTDGDDFAEDHAYDTLDDAIAALADDDEGAASTDQADPDEGEDVESDDPGAHKIILTDGTEITLKELEDGNLRMSDYTRKTTEIAKEREALAAMREQYTSRQQSLETAFHNFQQYIGKLIPAEPPLSLAQQNPGEYQYQMALRQAAMSELGQVLQMQDSARQEAVQADEAEIARYKQSEEAALVKAMPALKDPARLAKFYDDNRAFAVEMGAPEELVDQPQPAYVHHMLHYARIGKRAEHNRQNAQRRVAEAPKKGAEGRAAVPPNKNREAMKRLSKSGSLRDALNVDFD